MYGLPRPWYFPLQKSYWLGSGRVETWDWPWCGGGASRLSVMEEDQACAMEHRRSGKKAADHSAHSAAAKGCVPIIILKPFCSLSHSSKIYRCPSRNALE